MAKKTKFGKYGWVKNISHSSGKQRKKIDILAEKTWKLNNTTPDIPMSAYRLIYIFSSHLTSVTTEFFKYKYYQVNPERASHFSTWFAFWRNGLHASAFITFHRQKLIMDRLNWTSNAMSSLPGSALGTCFTWRTNSGNCQYTSTLQPSKYFLQY